MTAELFYSSSMLNRLLFMVTMNEGTFLAVMITCTQTQSLARLQAYTQALRLAESIVVPDKSASTMTRIRYRLQSLETSALAAQVYATVQSCRVSALLSCRDKRLTSTSRIT